MESFNLKAKTSVVTGGARGLGLAFAEALAEAGSNVAILDVGTPIEGSLENLSSRTGVKIQAYKVDVTSRASVTQTIESIEQDFGSVDVCVNAAGVAAEQSFLETTDDNLSKTFNVNFVGSFLVAQACAQAMVRKWEKLGKPAPNERAPVGSIIFIASVATHIATMAQTISCYTASKAAVRGLVKPLAMELAPYGIRVNSLSPGPTRTDMFKQVEQVFPDLPKQFQRESMFGRIAEPAELKPALLYLATASWTTGQDMLVDGGVSSWKHKGDW